MRSLKREKYSSRSREFCPEPCLDEDHQERDQRGDDERLVSPMLDQRDQRSDTEEHDRYRDDRAVRVLDDRVVLERRDPPPEALRPRRTSLARAGSSDQSTHADDA